MSVLTIVPLIGEETREFSTTRWSNIHTLQLIVKVGEFFPVFLVTSDQDVVRYQIFDSEGAYVPGDLDQGYWRILCREDAHKLSGMDFFSASLGMGLFTIETESENFHIQWGTKEMLHRDTIYPSMMYVGPEVTFIDPFTRMDDVDRLRSESEDLGGT